MVIKVSRVDTSKTAEATEEVPFESVKSDSAELFKGEEKVTQEGVAGPWSRRSSWSSWTAVKRPAPWSPAT